MRSKIFKFLIGAMLGLVVCLLLAFNALLIWVATGPRSLSVLTPYIESSFVTPEHHYSLNIGETWLIWDGWRHPIDIRLKDVAILTDENQIFSRFSEISLGIDVLSLPLGHLLPTSITISQPLISLIQNTDRSISLGFKQENSEVAAEASRAVPVEMLFAPLLSNSNNGPFRKLHSVLLKDANLSVSGAVHGLFFKADNVNILLQRDHDGNITINGGATMHYADNESQLRAEFSIMAETPLVNGVIEFSTIQPDELASLFSDNPNIKSITFPISGKTMLSMDMNGVLQNVGFDILGGKGEIISDKLEDAVPVTSLHMKGVLNNNFRDIFIESLTADLGGAQLAAHGTASLKDGDIAVDGELNIKNVSADQVNIFWPLAVSPMSREWITTNISKGIVSEANAKIKLNFGDLAKPILPKEDVDASIAIEGMQIKYLSDHPPTTGVKANIRVDAVSLHAMIESADFLDATKLSNGLLAIEDLNADNPYITLSLNADAPAKDIVKLLNLPRLEHAKHLGLGETTIEGKVKGNAKLGFNFFAPRNEKGKQIGEVDVAYDIKAEAINVSQPGFMQKFDLKNVNGSITINEKGVNFIGSGGVNGANTTDSKIKYLFNADHGVDTFIDIVASAPVESLPRFGYPEFSFLKGNLTIKAKLSEGENIENSEASIDLTEAAVDMPLINWKKSDKEPATLEVKTENTNGILHIVSFDLKGKKSAKGSMVLNKDFNVTKLDATNVSIATNNLEYIHYEHGDNGLVLDAKGSSADLTYYMASDDSELSFAEFPPTHITADIGTLILGKDRIVSGVKGELLCDNDFCSRGDFIGESANQKPFTFKILRNPRGRRQISLHAQDAGSFLRAIGVFDGIEGGDLTLVGNYDESAKGSTLNARIEITEHTIRNAPILAKILSLASLTGLIDTLQGNGITFTKFSVPLTLHDDIATIDNGRTFGSAIGMTVSGTITFPKKILDLNGTVVPSYALNTAINKVPVVGEMITGGKGEGVFAARYSVKGTTDNYSVSVNPLSILTPGFLRGLFDAFDEPKKKGNIDN